MTKLLSKLKNTADKARDIVLSVNITNCFFASCFRPYSTMVEQQQPTSSSKVQALYDFCKQTLTPSVFPPNSSATIQKLCSLLDTVGPSDVGLREESPDDDDRGHGFFGLNRLRSAARWAQPITYIDIYECDTFTMCIFCFPTSAVIPLHDHPSMTVFSKVLYGSLHVKAYDWVEPPCIQESKEPGYPPVRLAKLTTDKVLTAPCGTSVLYPKSGGNLHCFTALTPCAVLDILTPPYREDAGRKCAYYLDCPYSISTGSGAEISDGKVEDYAWLAEVETPETLYMRQGVYKGPVIYT